MRNVSRLRLLCFLLFTSLLMCCPLCYSLPCRNYAPPSKAFLISSILVAINPLSTFFDPASSLEYFWWRWGDSHPRPEPVSLCFIQQYNYLLYHFFKNFASCGGVHPSGFNTLPSARLITLPVTLSILDKLLRATSSHAPLTS